ncbi:hypothetical protein AB9P05_10325 [Roseivirga sp. BDSF3-8]|uniref:hypothetical protein n=1 Tax=Roseivirga sp. BDSF3-8 TaxID=3241598 RepID=UPI0035327020
MKQVLLTFFLSSFLAIPYAMAGGGQCEHSSKKAETQEDAPVEEAYESEDESHKVNPLNGSEKEVSRSWITTLESPEAKVKKETSDKGEEKQKEYTYSNYSFLFQLFYKYSLSDFFEAPSFRDEKKNSYQGWELDLTSQKQQASEWLNYWGRKLTQNLKQ